MRYLIVGGITVPLRAGLEIRQRYIDDLAQNDARMGDRSLRRQTYGVRKIQTEVTGRGTIPPSLQVLDTSQPLTISCIEPMGILSADPNIVLPTARRTDAGSLPHGRAFVGDRVVRTDCSMAGDTAQLTPVAGATYQALYYPEFLALIDIGPVEQPRGGLFGWSLVAREV